MIRMDTRIAYAVLAVPGRVGSQPRDGRASANGARQRSRGEQSQQHPHLRVVADAFGFDQGSLEKHYESLGYGPRVATARLQVGSHASQSLALAG
jgi:hypothetical protein